MTLGAPEAVAAQERRLIHRPPERRPEAGDRKEIVRQASHPVEKLPVLVEGGDTSIFGPSFGGGFASAVVVRVPREFQDYAVEIGSVFDASLSVEPPGPTDDQEDPDYPEVDE